jgi:hippurate hydrolase
MSVTAGLVYAAHGHGAAMADLRRGVAATGERGLATPRSQRLMLDALAAGLTGAEVSTGVGLSSVVAVIRGAHPGGVVLLRADLDSGAAAHAAALLGAAAVLTDRRADLCGDVVVAWQPGAAGDGGAGLMLGEGLLDVAGRPVDAAYAVRTVVGMPRGVVAVRAGLTIPAVDRMRIDLREVHPAGTRPVAVACQLAAALDRARLGEPGAVCVDQVAAGEASATVTVTVRAGHAATRTRLHEAIGRMTSGYAAAYGMAASVAPAAMCPAAISHPAEAGWIRRAVTDMLGAARLVDLATPTPAADDVGHILDVVPGAVALILGARAGGDDTLLPTAAAVAAGVAVARLDAGRVTPATVRRTRRAAPTVVSAARTATRDAETTTPAGPATASGPARPPAAGILPSAPRGAGQGGRREPDRRHTGGPAPGTTTRTWR